MDTLKMIEEINATCIAMETEKTELLRQISVIDDRMTFFKMAVEALEQAGADKKAEPVAEPPKQEVQASAPVRHGGKVARKIAFNGEEKTIEEWARTIGISKKSLASRLRNGWPLEKALTTGSTDPKTKMRMLEYNDITKSLPEWARQFGMTPQTLRNRLNRGMSVEEALLKPLDGRGTAHKEKKPIRGKIFMYDPYGNIIRQYVGIGDAANDLHVSPDVVEKIIRNVSVKDQIASRNFYLAIAS